MAIFRIVRSRKKPPEGPPEFDVQFSEGTLEPGDRFTVFETRHPVNFTVREVRRGEGRTVTLVCNKYIGWDEQFAGTEVDTAHPELAARYGYGRIA